MLVAENAFRTLYKISEIYDRIAFAGVGKYNEFEMLRVAGVRQADMKGYSFAREDVNGRALANAYGQTLGQVFTHEMKPYEVEILVAQVGETVDDDELYHILYDGTVMDEEGSTVLGGQAEEIARAGVTLLHRHGLRGGDPSRCVGARGSRHAARAPSSSRSRCSTALVHVEPSAASTAPSSSRSSTPAEPARRLPVAERADQAPPTGRPAGRPRSTRSSVDRAAVRAGVPPVGRCREGGVDLVGEQDVLGVVELVLGHEHVDAGHVAHGHP